MGAILAQQSPLCIADIEGLMDLRNPITHTLADIEHFVHRLQTVLVAGASEINSRIFPRVHRSFSDFVTSTGAEDFRVDTIHSNGELAIWCIRQLTRLWAGARRGLQEIPAQLPYVIENWASHLIRVVGAKVDEAQRDDESISTADTIDVLSDPDTNSRAQVGEEPTEKPARTDTLWCITFYPDGRRMAVTREESIRLRDTHG